MMQRYRFKDLQQIWGDGGILRASLNDIYPKSKTSTDGKFVPQLSNQRSLLQAAGANISVERAPYLYALLNDWANVLVLVVPQSMPMSRA